MSSLLPTSKPTVQQPPPERSPAIASAQELRNISIPWRFNRLHPPPNSNLGNPPASGSSEPSFKSEASCSIYDDLADDSTVFYLAYGSNLSAETFLGKRKIHPISALGVVVPSLKLTFDLPGIPYTEPCFANSALADEDDKKAYRSAREHYFDDEKDVGGRCSYHKDRWHKGLVGVAYELTKADLAKVIASEGGGVAYQDVIVPCYPLEKGSKTVPATPSTKPLEAHTLLAPPIELPDPDKPPSEPPQGGIIRRHKCGYAQASARYMKLIMDGAEEHKLPQEYREFLAQIRAYQITSSGQRIGNMIYTTVWGPLLMMAISITKLLADEEGRIPPWAARIMSWLFFLVWVSYDNIFKKLFGDGERTEGQGPLLEVSKTLQ